MADNELARAVARLWFATNWEGIVTRRSSRWFRTLSMQGAESKRVRVRVIRRYLLCIRETRF